MGPSPAHRPVAICAAFLLSAASLAGAQDVRIEGRVLLPGGDPARGAVVVSSAGGSAAVREDGSFSLDVALAPEVLALELTAVASGLHGSLSAARRIDALRDGPFRHAGTLVLAESAGSVPDWLPTFDGTPGVNSHVKALTVFDDGSGPALYAGGDFTVAGGQATARIARWDGQDWSALGSGVNDTVRALAVWDDGSGPALYAGGDFTVAGGQAANLIAKWDGQGWSPLAGGISAGFLGPCVLALAVFDDGSGAGPALYVGGSFESAGGQEAKMMARWDGQSWSPVGTWLDAQVHALAVFDDGLGAGPALYAGGGFHWIGGQELPGIARWDGQAWSGLGTAFGAPSVVLALSVFDDGLGAGPALVAGGNFSKIGTLSTKDIARWDGQAWSAFGSGTDGGVTALAVFDDGSGGGPALYAGGDFTSISGQQAQCIARWDGQGWSALSSGLDEPGALALAAFDDGSGGGPALYAGGAFLVAGGEEASFIAAWDASEWNAVGGGLDGAVHALTVFDDGAGDGPALYAGGDFVDAGGEAVNRIARWDGEDWSPLSAGMNGTVEALCVFDDGSGAGPALFAAGAFTSAGGAVASRIARWDGQGWSALASGTNDTVDALAVFDDGSGAGSALYVAGVFTVAGGQSAGGIARWDGQGWSGLAGGTNGLVHALGTFDDGSGGGPALYAGGFFTSAGGQAANHIARWDGQGWSALGSGTSGLVETLAVFDDGSGAGPALYAGGNFVGAGGVSAGRVARWDGLLWSALGSGTNSLVRALCVFDDGSGPALYAGGVFTSAGGLAASRIARWDGLFWSALGSGMNAPVFALAGFDDGAGTGSALYAGGSFDTSAAGDSYLARWGHPSIGTVPGCFGNPAVLAPLSNAAPIGGVLAASLSADQLASGLALLYFGADATDAAGCGAFIPGVGELLLALVPAPWLLAQAPLSAGAAAFALPVPDEPLLVGFQVLLQGIVLGLSDPGVPIEPSNALRVTFTAG